MLPDNCITAFFGQFNEVSRRELNVQYSRVPYYGERALAARSGNRAEPPCQIVCAAGIGEICVVLPGKLPDPLPIVKFARLHRLVATEIGHMRPDQTKCIPDRRIRSL